MVRYLVLMLLVSVLAAACGGSSSTKINGIEFEYPAKWHLQKLNMDMPDTLGGTQLALLQNDKRGDDDLEAGQYEIIIWTYQTNDTLEIWYRKNKDYITADGDDIHEDRVTMNGRSAIWLYRKNPVFSGKESLVILTKDGQTLFRVILNGSPIDDSIRAKLKVLVGSIKSQEVSN